MALELQGLHILNTRPQPQNRELSIILNRLGAQVFECPTLVIEFLPEEWVNTLPPLHTVAQAIFISPNAVHGSFQAFQKKGILWPKNLLTWAIGTGSQKTLQSYGVTDILLPQEADSEHLLVENTLQRVHNKIILLFKGKEGRPLLYDTLKSRGAHLITFEIYQRTLPSPLSIHQLESWHKEQRVDIILLTSEQGMRNLFHLYQDQCCWIRNTPCLVVSERIALIAKSLGIQTIITSTIDTMVHNLKQFKKGLRT